mgnify:CR=1 FL=1
MRLGQAAMEALQAEICGLLTPGNELVVAGAVALEGTVQIAKMKHDILREHFSESFLRNAGELRAVYGTVGENDDSCVLPENREDCCGEQLAAGGKRSATIIEKVEGCAAWKAAEAAGATALYVMGEGGFLSALWKMAEASQVGLEMDFTKVPIRQETIEICEIFDVNPYELESCGALLMTADNGHDIIKILSDAGIKASVIGRTTADPNKILRNDDEVRYLDTPNRDEVYRFI